MRLLIKSIRRDFQEPEWLREETITYMKEAMLRGDPLEPVVVRYDGAEYWLQDGFHRVTVAEALGHDEIEAEVIPGGLADIEADHKRMHQELLRKLREGTL